MIGKPFPRINGRAKVTGAARFTVDITLPGMLYAPHAALAACRMPRFAVDRSRCGRRAPDVRAVRADQLTRSSREPDDSRRGRRAVRALCRRAGRRRRRHLAGGGGDGAAPDPRRLRAAAVRRRHGRRARSRTRRGRSRRASVARHSSPAARAPARTCRSTAMCAARKRQRAATPPRASPQADVVVEGEYRTQVQTHCCMETACDRRRLARRRA